MNKKPTIQANNLNIIFKIWVIFSTDEWTTNKMTANTIGYDKRQGQYYNQALHAFGIFENKKISSTNHYRVKEEYRVNDIEEAKEFFREKATKAFFTKEIKSIEKENAGETRTRRQSAIKSWKAFIESGRISKKDNKKRSFEKGVAKTESTDPKHFKDPKKSKRIASTTESNKGFNHTIMMNVIGRYALDNEIQINKENCNADLTSYNEEQQTFKIIEIKSYAAIYMAIGQLLHYEHKFKKQVHTNQKLKYEKIYVGVEELSKQQQSLLKQLSIKYVKYSKEKLADIFN